MTRRQHIVVVALAIGLSSCVSPPVDIEAQSRRAAELQASAGYEAAYDYWLHIADTTQHPLAMFNLGLHHRLGWDRPVDPAMACRWFERAAAGRIPLAEEYHGDCLLGDAATQGNAELAQSFYLRAAEGGIVSAYCKAGKLYLDGPLPLTPARGVELCQQAADAGHAPSALYIGRWLLTQDVSPVLRVRAIPLLQAAATGGEAEAYFWLARVAQSAHPEEQHPDVASLFETAAARGFVPAYFETALAYFRRPPAPDHLAKAYLWTQAALARSEDEQVLAAAEQLMRSVEAAMPTSWRDQLDAVLAKHLAQFPPVPGRI